MSSPEHAALIPLRRLSCGAMKDAGWQPGTVETHNAAILLSTSPFALGQTILAAALPRIAFGWASTSFVLTQAIFILLHGQIVRIYSAELAASVIAVIRIFEVKLLVCIVSRNVDQLIAGRTISGGCRGNIRGLDPDCFTVHPSRGQTSTFWHDWRGLQSVTKNFLQRTRMSLGYFISPPSLEVPVPTVASTLKAESPLGSDPGRHARRDLWVQTLHMDLVGTTLDAEAITCFVPALQWPGNTKV